MASIWRSKLGGEFNRELIDRLDAEHLLTLRSLRSEPHNAHCADCGRANNSWASVNLGVFLCDRCADVHRALGAHISKVKACTGTDLWGPDEITQMKELDLVLPNKQAHCGAGTATELSKQELMDLCMEKYGMKTWACSNTSAHKKIGASASLPCSLGEATRGVPDVTLPLKAMSPFPPPTSDAKPSCIDESRGKRANCSFSVPKDARDFNFDAFFDILEPKAAIACMQDSSEQVGALKIICEKHTTSGYTDIHDLFGADASAGEDEAWEVICDKHMPNGYTDVHDLFGVDASALESSTIAPPPAALQRTSTDEVWEGFEDM